MWKSNCPTAFMEKIILFPLSGLRLTQASLCPDPALLFHLQGCKFSPLGPRRELFLSELVWLASLLHPAFLCLCPFPYVRNHFLLQTSIAWCANSVRPEALGAPGICVFPLEPGTQGLSSPLQSPLWGAQVCACSVSETSVVGIHQWRIVGWNTNGYSNVNIMLRYIYKARNNLPSSRENWYLKS